MKPIQQLKAVLLFSTMSMLVACGNEQQASAPTQMAPQVSVAEVVNQPISEWKTFTGRLEAPQTVSLRPRVSGYIEHVNFSEGSQVNAGDLLFEIDDRALRAEVQGLEADLEQAQSRFTLAKSEYTRAQSLASHAAISQEILDNRQAEWQQASANIRSVESALELAKLQLSYTRVEAPISGRVSRALITRGNYVNAGDTLLTTIVSTDKVFAYFDADEQAYLRYMQSAHQQTEQHTLVMMGLINENDFPHQGEIDFLDNQINGSTGTIRARAVFNNENGAFIPGLFARIRLNGGEAYTGILIDDKAIGTDLNNKFVLVLDDENKVQYRAVELGQKIAGLRVITKGLSGNERIVVNGLQRVRPGAQVAPQIVNMASDNTLAELQALHRLTQQQRTQDTAAVTRTRAAAGDI